MKQADLFRHGVTVDDLVKLQDEVQEAHKDDTPFVVASKDGLSVVGDPNKTEEKSKNYKIRFRFTPQEMERYDIDPKEVVRVVDGLSEIVMEFDDVSIKPRYVMEVNAAIVKIIPYIYGVNEETKKIGERSQEEMRQMVNDWSIEIGDDMYNLVAAVCRVDRRIVENMEWNDVMETVLKIFQDFPEVVNSSEGFSE